jgi:ubiquinone/menaquinone biosynthesis C-methylase UbiE
MLVRPTLYIQPLLSSLVEAKKRLRPLNAVKKYYNEYATKYDSDPYYETRLYDDLTWAFVEPYLPTDKLTPILDIGGGTGKWALKLAEMGYTIICADIAIEMLKIAQQKAKAKNLESKIIIKELDIRDMHEYPDNAFHLILALGDVISYALDDDIAVAEMWRVCKPGGVCIASVDNKLTYMMNELNYNHPERIEQVYRTGISHFFKSHQIKTYFPDELTALFVNQGFKIEKIIGKPVLTAGISKRDRKQKIMPNYESIFKIEKDLAEKPFCLGQAGHLQIIARKE